MITVDASVWTAVFEVKDRFHHESIRFLRASSVRNCRIYAPWLALVETGCALARRSRDGSKALAAVTDLRAIPILRLLDLDAGLLQESLELGAHLFLRGADAFYAATASLTGTTLITWDGELLERAGGMTPSDWLARNP